MLAEARGDVCGLLTVVLISFGRYGGAVQECGREQACAGRGAAYCDNLTGGAFVLCSHPIVCVLKLMLILFSGIHLVKPLVPPIQAASSRQGKQVRPA